MQAQKSIVVKNTFSHIPEDIGEVEIKANLIFGIKAIRTYPASDIILLKKVT